MYPPEKTYPRAKPAKNAKFGANILSFATLAIFARGNPISYFVTSLLFVVKFLLQYLAQQLLHRLRVEEADHLVLPSRRSLAVRQHFILGDVDTHGV